MPRSRRAAIAACASAASSRANEALLAPLGAREREQFTRLLIRISGTDG
ncbi:hypothetical protein [Streptomyces sp. SAS_272]